MKTIGLIVCGILAGVGYAQNSTFTLLGYAGKPVDVNSCYNPTPLVSTVVRKDQVLWVSANNGTSWEDLSTQLPKDIIINSANLIGEGMYLGTSDGEIYYNSDPLNGKWELQHVENDKKHEGAVAGIFECKSGLYASIIQSGFYNAQNGFFKYAPESNSWKPIFDNLENRVIISMVETQDGSLLVTSTDGMFRTSDEGKTWKHVYKGWVTGLTSDANIILANAPEGVIASSNNGATWKPVIDDKGAIYNIKTIDGIFVAMRLKGMSLSPTEKEQWVSISKDGGDTWQKMEAGNPADRSIADIGKVGNYLFSSRKAGISRSNDLGQTWQLVLSPNVTDGSVSFEIITTSKLIFAVVKSGGC